MHSQIRQPYLSGIAGRHLQTSGSSRMTAMAALRPQKFSGAQVPDSTISTLQGLHTVLQQMATNQITTKTTIEDMQANQEGMKTAIEGMQANQEGMKTAIEGMQANQEGMKTAIEGMQANQEGMQANQEGMKTVIEGLQATQNAQALEMKEVELRLTKEATKNKESLSIIIGGAAVLGNVAAFFQGYFTYLKQ